MNLDNEIMQSATAKLQSHYQEKRVFGAAKTKEMIFSLLPSVVEEMALRREGKSEDLGIGKFDNYTLHHYAKDVMGISFNELLRDMGIRADKLSLNDIIKKFGISGKEADVVNLVKGHSASSFSGSTQTVGGVNSDYRFLIPEIILSVMQSAYEESAYWNDWTSGTDTVSIRKGITAPYLKRGKSMPKELLEGESIQFGSVDFGQKSVNVKKYGIAFAITDEMIAEQKIDTLAYFMRMAASDTNIGENSKALDVLVNGEQTTGSESAAVVGVDAIADGFKQLDIDRVAAQFKALNMGMNRGISSIDNSLQDLNASLPNRERLTLASYTNVPVDLYDLPDANQILLFDKTMALRRLQYGAMKLETMRDPSKQIESVFLTFHSGFYIGKRDARVLLDRSKTFAAFPFPAFMDVQARRLESFGTF